MRPPRDSNSTAPPQSPSRAEAARFELAENARLALEAKSAQVEGLKVKLAAAEAALRERDEREREEQAARASSEHAGVMHEADRLGDEMKGALGNVKAFMRRAWTGAGQTASSETDDVTAGNRTPERRATNARDGHTPSSAMRSKAKTSIVEKPAARGAYLRAGGDSPGGDSSLVGRQRPKTVAFVGDREQRRLEREGEVVADNARLRRTVGELEQRLKRLARVARRATDAAESKFADERAARLDAEAACERLRAALEEVGGAGRSSGVGDEVGKVGAFGRSLVEELETSRSACRDVARRQMRGSGERSTRRDRRRASRARRARRRTPGRHRARLADNGVRRRRRRRWRRTDETPVRQSRVRADRDAGEGRRAERPEGSRGVGEESRRGGGEGLHDPASGGGGARGERGRNSRLDRPRRNPSVAVVDALRRHANDAATCAARRTRRGRRRITAASPSPRGSSPTVSSPRWPTRWRFTRRITTSSPRGRTRCVAWRRRPRRTRRRRRRRGRGGGGCGDEDGAADAIAAYPSTERWVASERR